VLYPIQLFEAELITSSVGTKTWETGARIRFCDEKYMFAHPAVSPDGKTLYFTSDMPGGYGGMDLWSSERISGEWNNPKNLGRIINTSLDESFATLRHPDTLFFSSNGHKGLGGLDIVFATRTDVSEDWLYVMDDLPYPINSSGDDFGVQFFPKGFQGVYTSDRNGIDALYQFSDYDPEITLFVEIVNELDGTPWPGIDAELEILGAPDLTKFTSDGSGKWSSRILREQTYMIQCPGALRYSAVPFTTPEDQTQKSLTITVPIPIVISVGCLDPFALNYNSKAIVDDGLCEYTRVITPLNAIIDNDKEILNDKDLITETKIIEGDIVNLKLHWNFDRAELKYYDRPIIEAFARHLIDNSNENVLVISHCDSRGKDTYNDVLSQARADAVREAFVRLGVSSERITTYGASEQFLLEQCKDEEDCKESVHQANRRTTANILRIDESVYVHRVKAGETLFGVAKKYRVRIQEIKIWNGLKSDKMRVGQDILIYLP